MNKKRWFFFILLIILIVGWVQKERWLPLLAVKKAEVNQRRGNEIAPVITVKVQEQSVPIWLEGIGTIQAFNTVTVRPRVGGTLEEVRFEEGSLVNKGDVLAQIDPRPYEAILKQAQAKKAQNEAQLKNALSELNRVKSLLKTSAVSQQLVDQSEATVAQLQASIQADEASIQSAQLDLDFTTVRAPLSGRTGVRLVDAGNIVTPNQTAGLVVVTQLQPISLIFTLPQQHLSSLNQQLKPGGKPLLVEAFTQQEEVLAEGTLELLDNQIDPTTGTLKLKAKFPNDDLSLWPGQFVSARLLLETRQNVTLVPSVAVRPGIDFKFCYVVKADDTVEVRPVKTSLQIHGMTLIDDGLKPGEEVVREGHNRLAENMKIRRVELKQEVQEETITLTSPVENQAAISTKNSEAQKETSK